MFPMIFAKGIEIGFAYTSFKWENNAKRNAGVTVAVIGLRTTRSGPKYIYTDDLQIAATNINGYLADGANVVIERRNEAAGEPCPRWCSDRCPNDGGGLDPVSRRERDE